MEERLIKLLKLALKYRATDIHFYLSYQKMNIEMRINGKCIKIVDKPGDNKMIRYLQYMANLDVCHMSEPQTGHFEMEVDNILLSLRFSCINEIEYTNGVLRILNNNTGVNIDNLSKIDNQNRYFKSLLKNTCGLIILSGPTGSGKTTTAYSLINSVKNKKIYTIEDPVEIRYDGLIQIQVNEAIDLDYSKGIKQILRHDPDIIMIGEIRDDKAAKAAVEAANTGHLVITTIHTSKASSVISRMCELGVNKDHLYENLLCISNQRMMINNITKDKHVIYEIMDQDEIEYYRDNNRNSKEFLTINKQIEKGRNEKIFV